MRGKGSRRPMESTTIGTQLILASKGIECPILVDFDVIHLSFLLASAPILMILVLERDLNLDDFSWRLGGSPKHIKPEDTGPGGGKWCCPWAPLQ